MANEIDRPTASQLTTTGEKNAFERYADAVNRNRIIGDLLKFSKGEWLKGRDAEEVPEGTELVAGIDRLQVGWVRWEDMRPTDQLMGYIADDFVPARRVDLGENDPQEWPRDEATGLPRDPWQLSNSMILMDPENQALFTFATSSKGGVAALGKLSGVYGKHVRQLPRDLPVVALHADSYKHSNRAFGKIFTPVFQIVLWIERDIFDRALDQDMQQAATDEAETEEEAEAPAPVERARQRVAAMKAPAAVIHREKQNAYAAAKGGGEPVRGRPKVATQGMAPTGAGSRSGPGAKGKRVDDPPF